MNESDKKRLTEWLGECVVSSMEEKIEHVLMTACDKEHSNRTFTTWQDFGDCFDKLVELGECSNFRMWAYLKFNPTCGIIKYDDDFEIWLHSRTESGEFMLCALVSEWLKEGVCEDIVTSAIKMYIRVGS